MLHNAPAKSRSHNLARLLVRDKATGEVHECEVVPCLGFPADQQRAKAIVPAVGPLHHPASRSTVHATDERWLAFLPNVRRDTAVTHRGLAVAECVAFIETAVARASDAAARFEDDRVERRGERPLVVQIGAAQHDAQRHAAPVGQDMSLDAELRPVGRVRSCEIPPFGAFTMTESSAPHCH